MLKIHFDDESRLRLIDDDERHAADLLDESNLAFTERVQQFTSTASLIHSALMNKQIQIEDEKRIVFRYFNNHTYLKAIGLQNKCNVNKQGIVVAEKRLNSLIHQKESELARYDLPIINSFS